MPLLRFDLIEGRSESEIRKILDVTHEVLLETLKVPKRDRYQVVHEHKRSRVIVEDAGLGFIRSDNVLLLQITSRPRSRARIAAVQTKVERNVRANLIERQGGCRDDDDEVEMIAVARAGYSKNVIEQASNEAQYYLGPKRAYEGRHIKITREIPTFELTPAQPYLRQTATIRRAITGRSARASGSVDGWSRSGRKSSVPKICPILTDSGVL